MSTCNWLDLQTLGSQPVVMPKNNPDHWYTDSQAGLQEERERAPLNQFNINT